MSADPRMDDGWMWQQLVDAVDLASYIAGPRFGDGPIPVHVVIDHPYLTPRAVAQTLASLYASSASEGIDGEMFALEAALAGHYPDWAAS